MMLDTHLMALLSSLHGAVLFFAGCFFGIRWGRQLPPPAEKPAPVAEVKGA